MSAPSPFFIVGCPRSGTSLLRDMLRSHPRISIPGESHFIPGFFRGYGDPRDELEARRLAARILGLHWVRAWRLRLTPDAFSADRTFRQVVSRLFAAVAADEGRERWGDKTPHYVREIATLIEIFPDCRIIHIYRDGRDVALSWLRVGFEPRNLFTAARLWREYVRAGRRAGRDLPPESYMEVRYESLLTRPEESMRRVCDFIGEAFDPLVLVPNFTERQRMRRFFGKKRPVRSGPRTRILPENFDKWRTAMAPSDRSLFESVAGDLLEELGYPTEGLARPVGRLEQLRWRLHHRFWWTMHRLNNVRGAALFHTDLRVRWARLKGRRAGDR
jgi:hypothetical protein